MSAQIPLILAFPFFLLIVGQMDLTSIVFSQLNSFVGAFSFFLAYGWLDSRLDIPQNNSSL